jgi:hypothetical protein
LEEKSAGPKIFKRNSSFEPLHFVKLLEKRKKCGINMEQEKTPKSVVFFGFWVVLSILFILVLDDVSWIFSVFILAPILALIGTYPLLAILIMLGIGLWD